MKTDYLKKLAEDLSDAIKCGRYFELTSHMRANIPKELDDSICDYYATFLVPFLKNHGYEVQTIEPQRFGSTSYVVS